MLLDARPRGHLAQVSGAVAAHALVTSCLSGTSSHPVGLGVDMVDVLAFTHDRSVGGDRWLHKMFTTTELADAAGDNARLASRFAAKEAVAKALGTGFRGVRPRDIEITKTADGQPRPRLHGGAERAASQHGIGSILVSMTTDGDFALAAALALPDLPAPTGGAHDEPDDAYAE